MRLFQRTRYLVLFVQRHAWSGIVVKIVIVVVVIFDVVNLVADRNWKT